MKFKKRWTLDESNPSSMFYSREETVDSVQANFDIRRFYSAEGFSVLVDGVEEQVIIQEHSNPYNSENIDKKIHLRNAANIARGSKVQWNTVTGERLFLVTGKPQSNLAYISTKMVECNFRLKWIDDLTGTIQEEDCVIGNFTLYSDGVVVGKDLNLGNNQTKILIPETEYTKRFQRDKRFIVSKNVFKITSFEDYVTPGIIVLILAETESSKNDNFELGLADYHLLSEYSIEITNKTQFISLSETIQLNAVLKKDGSALEDQPQFQYTSSDESIATVDENGFIIPLAEGVVSITVSYQNYADTATMTIVGVVSDNYSINLIGATDIKLNQSLTYTVEIFNNGIKMEGLHVSWSIKNKDSTTTNCAIIVSQNSQQCIVKAGSNSNFVGRYIVLRAEMDTDPSVYKEITIRINNII